MDNLVSEIKRIEEEAERLVTGAREQADRLQAQTATELESLRQKLEETTKAKSDSHAQERQDELREEEDRLRAEHAGRMEALRNAPEELLERLASGVLNRLKANDAR